MSGGRRLARYVHVRDDRGRPHSYGPDDEVPAWAAAKITSKQAWADGAPEPTVPPTPAPASDTPTAPKTHAEPAPPRSGRGSSTAAWAAYAQRRQVAVPADADREQIIDLLEAAGVPVD